MRLDPAAVAQELRRRGLDGWLLYDFRGQNPTAVAALGLEDRFLSRRWFYWLGADGRAAHVVHAIERGSFPALPGETIVFAAHTALRDALERVLAGRPRVAMEYCPLGAIPTLSRVDAGTVELVRACGAREVVSSADLVQHFLCRFGPEQAASHERAVLGLHAVKDAAFRMVAARVRAGQPPLETEVQEAMLAEMARRGLRTDKPPIVASGAHAGDPHYAPGHGAPTPIREGEVLLLDLWAKEPDPRAVWGDITWMGFVGRAVPADVAEVFAIVAGARDLGLRTVRDGLVAGGRLEGWQVDRAVRDFIAARGYGDAFTHRTGHSIGDTCVHGDGANLDDFETHDTRELVPGVAFSIEPGIYLPRFGVRSEIDVLLTPAGPRVFGALQDAVIPLLE